MRLHSECRYLKVQRMYRYKSDSLLQLSQVAIHHASLVMVRLEKVVGSTKYIVPNHLHDVVDCDLAMISLTLTAQIWTD